MILNSKSYSYFLGSSVCLLFSHKNRKNKLVVPVVRLCLGAKGVRVTGASLWNRLHKDMVQYRLMKCFKVKWRIITYQNTICDVLIFYHVVLWYSKPSLWNMIAYWIVPIWETIALVVMFDPCFPSYFSICFCLVVSKMNFTLPWQPPTDNITCIMFS